MSYKADDYVDVNTRIAEFYERYPEGSLKSGSEPSILEVGGKWFVAYHAQAFRTPDDPAPADGWAWEPVPGPTNFTRDSELMNAETSAWGRAIVALGFKTKHLASQNEVENRQKTEQKNGGFSSEPDVVLLQNKAQKPSELPVHFGKNRGVLLGSLTDQQLGWYAHQWKIQEDPSEYDTLLKASAVALASGEDRPFNQEPDEDPFPDVPF